SSRRRHTRFSRDWSSDVCSSDLPIVKALERCGFALVIASDGAAKTLLEKEFPHLEVLELPGYGITYGKNRKDFKRHLRRRLPERSEERRVGNEWRSRETLRVTGK